MCVMATMNEAVYIAFLKYILRTLILTFRFRLVRGEQLHSLPNLFDLEQAIETNSCLESGFKPDTRATKRPFRRWLKICRP